MNYHGKSKLLAACLLLLLLLVSCGRGLDGTNCIAVQKDMNEAISLREVLCVLQMTAISLSTAATILFTVTVKMVVRTTTKTTLIIVIDVVIIIIIIIVVLIIVIIKIIIIIIIIIIMTTMTIRRNLTEDKYLHRRRK